MAKNKINNRINSAQTPIQTPLLRLLVRYFGNLSIQLHQVSRYQPTSVLNFAWNLVLVGAFLYEMTTRENEFYRNRANSMNAMAEHLKKPLFRVLVSDMLRSIFPISYALRVLYFIVLSLNGSSLIHLLDQLSPAVNHQVEVIKEQSKTLILLVLVVFSQQFLFLFSNIQLLLNMSKNLSLFDSFMQYLMLHSLYISKNMGHFLVIYCKYATLKSLKKAFRCFKVTGNLDALQHEIARLSLLNSKFSQLVSFYYIFVLVPSIIELLITLTCLVIDQGQDHDLMTINYLIYTTLIVSLCSEIERQLLEIQRFILKPLKWKQTFKKRLFKYSQLYICEKQNNHRQSLKWFELVPLYRKCFQLKIYSFFTVNWKFVFLLSIFVSNFVVLISQTSGTN